MAEQKKDPIAVWQEFLGGMERDFNAFANKTMASDEFGRAMHDATGASMKVQSGVSEGMQRYLATLNLPSRADLTNIGERLQAMEARLNHMSSLLERLVGASGVSPPAAPAAPRRTRQPPKSAKPATGDSKKREDPRP